MAVNLVVEPYKGLIDEPVRIALNSLSPYQNVTLSAELKERKMKFVSYAFYVADESGQVDVNKMESIGGTYKGVEPMGLFWSMIQAPGQRKGLRLVTNDVTTPYKVDLYVHNTHFDPFSHHKDHEFIARATVYRMYMKEGVRRVVVRAGRIRGSVFIPPGEGPFPGVIDIYGTGGGLKDHRAALLSAYGYTTFSLAYFDYEDLPKMLDVDIEYFEEAIDWFNSRPYIMTETVAIIGSSFGAELAMLTASLVHKLKAVVTISNNPYITTCGHTYKGQFYNYLPWDYSFTKFDNDGNFIMNSSPFPRLPEARIRLENFRCPMLILQGTEDVSTYPSAAEDVANMEHELGKLDVEVVTYEGAGHLLEPPFTPLCYMSYHGIMSTTVVWGGQPVPHARAQEDLWKRMLKFLDKHLNGVNISKL